MMSINCSPLQTRANREKLSPDIDAHQQGCELKQTIAVTGATGFIGQTICRQLLTDKYAVRVLVRQSQDTTREVFDGAEVVRGDLGNQSSLSRLVDGVEAVIHCAGRVRGATQAQFDQVNVDGTRNLLRAIKTTESGPRLLLISSLAAREPELSFYAASKQGAEELLKSDGGDVLWTILRPPAVYGPGDREMLPIFRLMARGIAITPGSPAARFSLLHVNDLTSAVMAWLRIDASQRQTFEIDDGRTSGYDWHEVRDVVEELCGRKIRVIQAASWWLDLPAWINSRIGVAFGTSPMLTTQKLRELRHPDWVSDNSAFRQAAKWQPRVSLSAGLSTTPNWAGYRSPTTTVHAD